MAFYFGQHGRSWVGTLKHWPRRVPLNLSFIEKVAVGRSTRLLPHYLAAGVKYTFSFPFSHRL